MKKSNTKRFRTNTESAKPRKLILSSISGAAIGIPIFLFILLLFAAVSTVLDSPHIFLLPFCFFSVYSSAFLAGLFSIKLNSSSNALICGSLCGVSFMLMLWGMLTLVGYALPSNDAAPLSFVLKLLIIPLSILGSFAGMAQKNGKKKKRKF